MSEVVVQKAADGRWWREDKGQERKARGEKGRETTERAGGIFHRRSKGQRRKGAAAAAGLCCQAQCLAVVARVQPRGAIAVP